MIFSNLRRSDLTRYSRVLKRMNLPAPPNVSNNIGENNNGTNYSNNNTDSFASDNNNSSNNGNTVNPKTSNNGRLFNTKQIGMDKGTLNQAIWESQYAAKTRVSRGVIAVQKMWEKENEKKK